MSTLPVAKGCPAPVTLSQEPLGSVFIANLAALNTNYVNTAGSEAPNQRCPNGQSWWTTSLSQNTPIGGVNVFPFVCATDQNDAVQKFQGLANTKFDKVIGSVDQSFSQGAGQNFKYLCTYASSQNPNAQLQYSNQFSYYPW